MTKSRWITGTAVVLAAALPIAAALPQEERIERSGLTAAATAEEDASGERMVKREIRVMVVDGEGGEMKVLEEVLADGEHPRVIRLGGETGDHPRVRVLHGGPGAMRFLSPVEGRGYLGVQLLDITPELRVHLGAGEESGLLVARVEAGSPAELAGLEVGDVLTHVAGEAVASDVDVVRRVRLLTAGQGVALEVVRQGRVQTLSATIAEREQPQIEARALLRRLGEDGETRVWEIDPTELGKRMGEVTEMFASPEWRDKVRMLTVTGEGLEQRLEEMAREIERLEKQLDEQNRELEQLR